MHIPYVVLTPGTDTGMGLLVEGPFRDFPSSEGPDGNPRAPPISGFFFEMIAVFFTIFEIHRSNLDFSKF